MKLKESALKTESIVFNSSLVPQQIAATIFTDPTVTPRAILQLSHGMAEHIMRYEPFAAFMAQNGFVVCGNDHLGHGKTSGDSAQDGFFATENGRDYVLKDLYEMNNIIRARYPDLPVILFGHSMGSFFARWFIEVYPQAADAAVICGTGGSNPISGIGTLIMSVIKKCKGPTHISKFVDGLVFGAYQKRIPDAATAYDWLSVNTQNVEDYIADPKCGFPFTVGAFYDVVTLLQYVNTDRWASAVRKDIPLYFIAGREDPVGNYGKGVVEVATRLQKAGVKNISIKLYNQMRHEILNENEKEIVWGDVLAWSENVLRALA